MTRRFGADGPELHRGGWDVVPVKPKQKRVVEPGWQHGFPIERIERFALNGYAEGNIGLLAARFPGVDIDVRDEQCAAAIEACALRVLGPAPVRFGSRPKRLLMYATTAPFSKVKVFLTGPNGPKGDDGKDYAVEILGEGQQYVVYGEHPDGFEYEWVGASGPGDLEVWDLTWIDTADVSRFVADLPSCLPEGWSVRSSSAVTASPAATIDLGELALANYKPALDGWDADRVRADIAPHLDLEMPYDDWIRVGQALHHQFGGSEEGFELWDEIFQESSKYGGPEYGLARWRSFKTVRAVGNGGVTLASLVKQTKAARQQAQRDERDQQLDKFKRQVEACSDARDLQDQVAAQIANTAGLTDVERETLATAIQTRAKDLGVRLPIGTVRGWVRSRSGVQQAAPMPEWAAPWVYITDGDKFFHTETKQETTSQGFRALHNRFMPLDPQGNRERADQWAVDMWGMPVVAHKAYMPGADTVFEMFGRKWVNLYRPESVPAVPDQYSADDLAAIAAVELHLRTYLADQRERDLLVSWIAWNVQHPGKKIRWSPYIHGVPGDGKSFFSELVAAAMGGQNVRSLNGSTLESNFTDWASGYALIAIEEMKQHGHNRYDVMNRLKPFITNSQVEIHPKGKASYTAPNVSNYIVFSNYLDGAPVDASDRRYMFLSSQLTTAQAQQLTQDGYFTRLFAAVHEHPGAMRKWLLETELHPEFDADGRAPDTDVKRTVVEMSKGDLELIAEDVIERGAEGVSRNVLSSAHLVRAMISAGAEAPSTTRVNTLLSRLGYRFAARKKWKGEACRVWVQQGAVMSDADVVTALNATGDGSMDFLE